MRVPTCLVLIAAILGSGPLWGEAGVREPSVEPDSIGIFAGHADVGNISRPGSVSYDPEEQTYLIDGSGQNMWSNHDDFHLVWKKLSGDFILRARAEFQGEGVHPHRKLGWIVRADLQPSSPHISLAVHGDGLTALQFRRTAGAETESTLR